MSYGNGGQFGGPESPQGGQRGYPQSYNDPSFARPPQTSSNRTLFWILGIIAMVAIGGIVACCGFGFFGFRMATTELAKQFRPQIQNSPEIVEHIGEIHEMSFSLQGTQQAGEPGVMAFDVTGSKGSGQIAVDTARAEHAPDQAFELILPDGRRMPLTGVSPARSRFAPAEPVPVEELPDTDPSESLSDPPLNRTEPVEPETSLEADVLQ
jgi:hypothetical protein